jgi:mono/diheme cytochrome c family protein
MGELAVEERIEESNSAYAALSAEELERRFVALETNIPNRLRKIGIELNGDGTTENLGYLAQRQAILDSFSIATSRGYLPRLTQTLADLEAGTLSELDFTNYLTEEANRLAQVSWGGTQEGYILTTLIHGRPGSNTVWPRPMVSWSQRGGGQFRDDQIRDIIAFIMNWNKGENWTLTDLNNVQQFAKLHAAYTGDTASTGAEATQEALVCTTNPDCVGILGTSQEIAAMLPAGDAANGNSLYTANACVGCHVGGVVGPDLAGTLTRVETDRLTLEQFAGWTPDDYLVDAIVYPSHFVVPGFPDAMPKNFGQILGLQELADIIAYIKEQ